jgi:alpha-tubulin suppressor-like RCC1 family protein
LEISAEDLQDLIKKIANQEYKKQSSDLAFFKSGVIQSTSGGRFTVVIPTDGSIYSGLLNQTGKTLTNGDSVRIIMKGNRAGDAYIAVKCGATVDGT